ncbi:MAGa3780 family membrane protein [Mycoplasmopsis gallinarum]
MEQILKFKQKIKNLNWKQKTTFWLSIVMGLFFLSAIIISWIVTRNLMLKNLNKLTLEEKTLIFQAGYYPRIIPEFWDITSYFTYISNFLLIVAFFLFALFTNKKSLQRFAFLTTVYITITFSVFWTLIFPESFNGKLNPWSFFASLLVHLINPTIGIILLGINRKEINLSKWTINLAPLTLLGYYLIALVIYFIGLPVTQAVEEINVSARVFNDTRLVIYPFLNFLKPLFTNGENLTLTIFLNILIVVMGLTIPYAFAWMWKGIYKIKILKINQ